MLTVQGRGFLLDGHPFFFLGDTAWLLFSRLHTDEIRRYPDVRLEFAFTGLNLQVFCGETLIDDCFNIDGTYVMHLRDYLRYLDKTDAFIFRAAPKTRTGLSAVYNEVPIPLNSTGLTLKSAMVYRADIL